MVGIYKITNLINNKIYIGQSGRIEARFNQHKKKAFDKDDAGYNGELYTEIRKYGLDNFQFEIIEEIDLTILEEKYIKEYIQDGQYLYNKTLSPTKEHGYNGRNYIFSNKDIDKIFFLLKEGKLSNREISEIYECSSSTIDDINNGKRYKRDNENYPIGKYKRNSGSNNANAVYTEEEVLEIRKYYVNHSGSETYKKYGIGKISSLRSFERILHGTNYPDVPIYKKREKKWVGSPIQEGCID